MTPMNMTPGIPAGESGYAITTEALIRAREGTTEYIRCFENTGTAGRRALRYGDVGQKFQTMFLGIRPMADFSGESVSYGALAGLGLPQRFRWVGGDPLVARTVYDTDQVRRILTLYPEYFANYTEGQDIDAYMDGMYESARPVSTLPDEERRLFHIRNGLLFGYPLDAVLAYADTKTLESFRYVTSHGFRFRSPDTTQVDQFARRIDALYATSGMDKFLHSARSRFPFRFRRRHNQP